MARTPMIRPRKQPKQRRSMAMVDAILEATAQVLIQDGYERATTNKIAAKAGVSIGSLYQYFPNKEALVAALNTRLGLSELEMIRAKFAEIGNLPVPQAIAALVTSMVELHRMEPRLHRVLVEQVPRVGDLKKISEIDDRIRDLMRAYLDRQYPELPADELNLMIFVIFNVVETLTHNAVLHHPELLTDGRLAADICRVVEAYLSQKTPR
jgi:AcrR family transcriptional regulator